MQMDNKPGALPSPAPTVTLTEEQRVCLRAQAVKALQEAAAALTKTWNLPPIDLTSHAEQVIDRLVQHASTGLLRGILQEIAELPRIGRNIPQAVRHEANHVALLAIGDMLRVQAGQGAAAQPKSGYFHLNLTLPHDLDAALTDIGNRARASGGFKLRKTEILRSLIRLLLELEIDLRGVRTEDDFLLRLRKAIGREQGGRQTRYSFRRLLTNTDADSK